MATTLAANLVEEWWADFTETTASDAALGELIRRIATMHVAADHPAVAPCASSSPARRPY
jgi:hypothetical protein